jgi:transglutaminase-like putative cysteine protease
MKRVLCALAVLSATAAHANEAALTTRFTYEAGAPAAAGKVRLWVPLPSDSAWQKVSDVQIEGAKARLSTEKKFGNRMAYFEGNAPLKVKVSFTVARRDVRVLNAQEASESAKPKWLKWSLQADSKVPVGGRYSDMARQIAGEKTEPVTAMRAFYDNVVNTMQYDYKKESPKLGEGDVAFVCDYKKGNCSDLHSYIISLGRSIGVPAVLEYGFPLTGIPLDEPLKREGTISGYHCWTWFKDGDRWIPLDASDARRWLDKDKPALRDFLFGNLVTPRSAVAISRGRDIHLVPAQSGAALNYFIYPYAEVGNVPMKAEWTMSYKLLP